MFLNVLRRRESAARVAVGALAKLFLKQLDIEVLSHVVAVGAANVEHEVPWEKIKPVAAAKKFC